MKLKRRSKSRMGMRPSEEQVIGGGSGTGEQDSNTSSRLDRVEQMITGLHQMLAWMEQQQQAAAAQGEAVNRPAAPTAVVPDDVSPAKVRAAPPAMSASQVYVQATAHMLSTPAPQQVPPGSSSRAPEPKKPRRDEPAARGDRRSDSSRRPDESRRIRDLPHFGRLPSEILPIIKKLPEFRRPEPMTKPPSGHVANQYCEYHKDFGHTTDQCRSLKVEIVEMLRRDIIEKDVVDWRTKERTPEEERLARGGKGVVLVLAGGSAGGGDSGRKRK
ncbi:hypothetical protein Taro_028182, partial [Colocasia esculenta]|nr:hypothetical protein [Colocasia esculenta]